MNTTRLALLLSAVAVFATGAFGQVLPKPSSEHDAYLLPAKDANLGGILLVLETNAQQMCGETSDANFVNTSSRTWKWRGPEVVRTYPPDDVVERISPEMKEGKPVGRWVPFTVQLVYRDEQGHVTRTENYASREFDPVFPKPK